MKAGERRYQTIVRAAGVTLLALLLSFLLSSPMTASFSALFSNSHSQDFRTTDLYAQTADSRPVRLLDDRILMVDIGHAGREEITECLEILNLCEPRAIGLDVNFAIPKEDDTRLLRVVTNTPNLVLPLGLEQTGDNKFMISDQPFFYGSIPGLAYGAVNFPAESRKASIREYATKFVTERGDTVPSFVMALARIGDPDKAQKILARGSQHEVIDYPSREFQILDIADVADNAEKFTGRYVIIGALSEASDMHTTPINPRMSGMEIHAYSLASLLDGRHIAEMPEWVDILIASALCFLIIYFALTLQGKLRGVTLRFMQVVLMIATVMLGYYVYIEKSIICNLSHTVIMIAFGLFALDVWNGLEWLGSSVAKIYRKLKNRRCESQF